jgi:transposase
MEMEKAKEILKLSLQAGLSQRDVAAATGCSPGTVSTILARVKEAGVSDPLDLDTKELGSIIYPPGTGSGRAKAEPDLAYINREMKKKGVTLFLLWEEYKEQYPQGFMYTQFCKKYRDYRKHNNVYLRKVYKAGERMLVDWAGLTMSYTDEQGKEKKAYLFVAVLPASSYGYTEPFRDMTLQSWIEAHIHALEYFGGTPRLFVPDNAKTAVIKADYYDPSLNKTYREMADYYGAAIVPARPLAPTDKAPVETSVQIVERRIIAKLRDRQFLSFAEVREAVAAELEILNRQPFQKLPGNRMSVFLETEKTTLMRLPERRYEIAQWKKAKVNFDYHVSFGKNVYYSVPWQFTGKEVDIRATSSTLEVFYQGERIACHVRSYDTRRRYITCDTHMPEQHRAVTGWSPQRFISWAAKTGEKTKAYITWLLEHRDHPEQAYKTCAGILRLASGVPVEQMEHACSLALARNIYAYRYFKTLLQSAGESSPPPIRHENLRGPLYYQEENHAE